MDELTLEKAKAYRKLIEKAVQSLDDSDALKCVTLYEKWSGDGVEYAEGKKVRDDGVLYRVRQAHTSQAGYKPKLTPALFEVINETNKGTKDDPIPYVSGMTLESGKYYVEDSVIYLCNRDTGTAVYNKLSELVGIYVTKVDATETE